jgi:NADPH-dependent curcumin reductase CurA
MAVPAHTKAWILQNKPETAVNFSSTCDATFALKTFEIPSWIPEDSLLVKVIWISNDPAQRGWIQKGVDPKVRTQLLATVISKRFYLDQLVIFRDCIFALWKKAKSCPAVHLQKSS